MKRCPDCGEVKSSGEFHRDRTRRDSLASYCRICNRRRNREYCRAHRPEGRQRDKRSKLAKRLADPEAWKLNREARRRRAYVAAPHKYRARDAVSYAVRTGKIPPARALACVDCGGSASQYDHTHGYDRENRFRVEPVCVPCHARRFVERGEGKKYA